MRQFKIMQNVLIGATAALSFSGHFAQASQPKAPVLATTLAVTKAASTTDAPASAKSGSTSSSTEAALAALSGQVGTLSHPKALERAFHSYFAYKNANPNEVKKPYLYFVDYGQSSTAKRGYVFDMESLTIVDGPFTVAHGRGSSAGKIGVPTRFSNTSGAATTSLGLYKTAGTYAFSGHASGQLYRSIGLRLIGLSGKWNDNALARGVVAHGAPYVTANGSGRSQGCPAMEPARAERLLPKLAGGAMVFLFAPNAEWMANDPWATA